MDDYKDKLVSVLTCDGRHIVGMLKGFDQMTNLILDDACERVYSNNQGVEQVPLGLYIIRGDNVAVVGDVDVELERRIDLSEVRAEPLGSIWW